MVAELELTISKKEFKVTFLVKKPAQSLRKSVARLRPERAHFDEFAASFASFARSLDTEKSEEFNKKVLTDFLCQTLYKSSGYYVNVKGAVDLAIHAGSSPDEPVGVMIEVKSPSNKAEMVLKSDLNRKSFHELILYFLRERFGERPNLAVRNLIITNGFAWFVFDAAQFEKHIAGDKSLIAKFRAFEAGQLSGTKTDFFYKEIASDVAKNLPPDFEFTHFEITDYEMESFTKGSKKETKILNLFRFLSPENLLKLNRENDSNQLNRGFYNELLHIMGLEEVRTSTKRLIRRKKSRERNSGSLLEATILQLETLGKIDRLEEPEKFGETLEEQTFAVALQLVLTWVNRVLFLKLLEAQLTSFNSPGSVNPFITPNAVREFDDLNSLFFQVVALKHHERPSDLSPAFEGLPYLNSSLFQPSELEQTCIVVSNLRDHLTMPIRKGTVLRSADGARLSGEIETLSYLLRFLSSYDFSSEGRTDIKEIERPLITASVLGLIFEKINGYKDGAFFTPGEVTMNMARSLVEKAILDKFRQTKGWECASLDDLYDKIEDRDEANRIIDDLRICDPAVGSGHFLVSILNEIIFVKSDLGLLRDASGRRLKEYSIEVVHDELLISDDDGEVFFYTRNSKEGRRVQEAVFGEKQRLLERCIFGVDINPNSVNICRLRLWIELLKSSYYDDDGELKTLPNIDINIREGNSLVSRYSIDEGASPAAAYAKAVIDYQEAETREARKTAAKEIEKLRGKFAAEMLAREPRYIQLQQLRSQRLALDAQADLFGSESEAKQVEQRKLEIENKIASAAKKVSDIEKLSKEELSFEWRYEFPTLLNAEGAFAGFDVVIGNPPYGVPIQGAARHYVEKTLGKVPDYEIYYWFINRARQILRDGGLLGFIIPNSILFNVGAKGYRSALLASWSILELLDCTDFNVFGDATVRNAVLILRKGGGDGSIGFRNPKGRLSYSELIESELKSAPAETVYHLMDNWGQVVREQDPKIVKLISKLKSASKISDEFEVSQGYIPYRLSDLQKDFGEKRGREIKENREWHADHKVNSDYVEELKGESLSRYSFVPSGNWVKYGPHLAGYVDPKFFNQRRVLVREITNPQIIATIVDGHLVNDPQIISIIPMKNDTQLEIVWAILSSRFGAFYHVNSSPKATKGLFPKILVQDIKGFPLPSSTNEAATFWLSAWARLALNDGNNGRTDRLYRIERRIDLAVCRYYNLSKTEADFVLTAPKPLNSVSISTQSEASEAVDAESVDGKV